MKRLALFLDGTWNKVSDNTNVWRLRALCAHTSADGCAQRAYYSTGLGTKFGEKIRGGMFGIGIDTAITSAYEWLVQNYETDDEIYIFGFSRGAYTARSLSGFISKCGLLQNGAPLGVNQLYMRYRREKAKTIATLIGDNKNGAAAADTEEQWMLKYARFVHIKFIGIFDTVGALGVPFPLYHRLKGEAYPFLNTGLRQNNEYAFHALAIDENRKPFAPTLWTNFGATHVTPRPIERTEQRWFVGAHANVGGGCFSDPLAQLPLRWLESKATRLGLAFTDRFAPEQSAETAQVSDSFADFAYGLYRLARLGIRYHRHLDTPPKKEKSEDPAAKNINETIDASVFRRWRADENYRPLTLRRWARKKNIALAKITGSVRADDPTITVADAG